MEDILCIDLLPNRFDALYPTIFVVNNNVTIPPQNHDVTNVYHSSTNNLIGSKWPWNRFEIYGSVLEITLFFSCSRTISWLFDSVNINGNRTKFRNRKLGLCETDPVWLTEGPLLWVIPFIMVVINRNLSKFYLGSVFQKCMFAYQQFKLPRNSGVFYPPVPFIYMALLLPRDLYHSFCF